MINQSQSPKVREYKETNASPQSSLWPILELRNEDTVDPPQVSQVTQQTSDSNSDLECCEDIEDIAIKTPQTRRLEVLYDQNYIS